MPAWRCQWRRWDRAIAALAVPLSTLALAFGPRDYFSLMVLSLPANAVMALMVGALTIHDIQPGPLVATRNPDLFWGLIASMWIGNLMLVVLNLPVAPLLLGFVLGPAVEESFRRTMLLSRGNAAMFFTSPLSAGLLALGVAALATTLWPRMRRVRAAAMD